MLGFRRERGLFVAELDPAERAVVAAVVADVAELLGAGRLEDTRPAAAPDGWPPTPSPDPVAPPQDEAVRRLLPDASKDPDVAAEFRRLTEDDLRLAKTRRLERLWTALTTGAPPDWPSDALVVEPAEASQVAATLTDVRLVLADRLGIEDEEGSDELYADLDAQDGPGPDDATDDPDAVSAAQVRRYVGSVYSALSWLQESLMALLLDDLRRSSGTGAPSR